MKKGDWVLFPMTKDDRDNPNVVAQVESIEDNIVNVKLKTGIIPIPLNYCRVVYVQIT